MISQFAYFLPSTYQVKQTTNIIDSNGQNYYLNIKALGAGAILQLSTATQGYVNFRAVRIA